MATFSDRFRPVVTGFRCVGALLLLGVFPPACAESERAPMLHVNNARGGSQSHDDAGTAGGNDTTEPTNADGLFDPSDLYVIGRLDNSLSQFVQFHLSKPNYYSGGFPTFMVAELTTLHGGDLYYVASVGTRRFVPELGTSQAPETVSYPQNPVTNDPFLTTPVCQGTPGLVGADGPALEGGAIANLPGPDGNVVYKCQNSSWYEGNAHVSDGSSDIVALGHDRLAWVSKSGGLEHGLLHLDDGTYTRILEVTRPPVAIRSAEEGFHVVILDPKNVPQLVAVHSDATTEVLGSYARFGDDAVDPLEREAFGGALTPDDTLFQIINGQILRRKTDGSSDIVYAGPTDGCCKLARGGAWLVTGP